MATTINLTDAVSTLVTITNTLIGEVGQPGSLETTYTNDLVGAINEINTKVVAIDTAAEIAAKVEDFFNTQGNVLDVRGFHADSANMDSAHITTLSSTTMNTGAINASSGNVSFDSAAITNLAVGDTGNLGHVKPLSIKNSSGTTILTGYLLSTSSVDGTL